jgi:hypothetical protein
MAERARTKQACPHLGRSLASGATKHLLRTPIPVPPLRTQFPKQDQDNQENQLPERDSNVETKKEDGSVHYTVPGSALPVRSVDTESDDYNDRQASALLRYKVTGVVGDFIDPLRDQEPDIAPEFGISPHPELHNPPPPKSAVGSVASNTRLTAPVEDKVEADDPSLAQGLSAGLSSCHLTTLNVSSRTANGCAYLLTAVRCMADSTPRVLAKHK